MWRLVRAGLRRYTGCWEFGPLDQREFTDLRVSEEASPHTEQTYERAEQRKDERFRQEQASSACAYHGMPFLSMLLDRLIIKNYVYSLLLLTRT